MLAAQLTQPAGTKRKRSLAPERPLNQTDYSGWETWMPGSNMKGTKLKMNQLRQKQALKSQNINHSSFKNYYSQFNDEQYCLADTEQLQMSQLPTTHAGFTAVRRTADPSVKNIRRIAREESEAIRARTMMVTSSNGFRQKQKTVRNFNLFASDNLGARMNDYMNIFIREDYNRINLEGSLENYIPITTPNQQTNNESQHVFNKIVIPHKQKLSAFQRKMRVSRRQIATASHSNSVRKNMKSKQDIWALNKTLDSSTLQSPLVNSLENRKALKNTIEAGRKRKSLNRIVLF